MSNLSQHHDPLVISNNITRKYLLCLVSLSHDPSRAMIICTLRASTPQGDVPQFIFSQHFRTILVYVLPLMNSTSHAVFIHIHKLPPTISTSHAIILHERGPLLVTSVSCIGLLDEIDPTQVTFESRVVTLHVIFLLQGPSSHCAKVFSTE